MNRYLAKGACHTLSFAPVIKNNVIICHIRRRSYLFLMSIGIWTKDKTNKIQMCINTTQFINKLE